MTTTATSLHAPGHPHQRSMSTITIPSMRKNGLVSPRLFAKLSAGFSHQPTNNNIEHKMAQLRAAYATPTVVTKPVSLTPNIGRRNGPTRASLPTPTIGELMLDPQFGSRSTTTSRRSSTVSMPAPSIMELATSAGLLALSPSDLVFESSVFGIAYYDFVLSVNEVTARRSPSPANRPQRRASAVPQVQVMQASPAKRRVHGTGSEPTASSIPAAITATQQRKKGLWKQRPKTAEHGTRNAAEEQKAPMMSIEKIVTTEPEECKVDDETDNGKLYRLFLAKLDSHTNVEWFESVLVPSDLLSRNGIPVSELSLLTMGILVWRARLQGARLLCLATGVLNSGDDATAALEALKRAAGKYKCAHHVLTIGQRRQSAASTHSTSSSASYKSSSSSGSCGSTYHHSQPQQDPGMKLRVLMCQSRYELSEIPTQALRDTKFLLAPSSNPLLCLCFPLT